MFKYLWILIAPVLGGALIYYLYNVIKEAVDDGNTSISDIIEYMGDYHENFVVVLGVVFVFSCTGVLFLFIGSIVAFIEYYLG